MKELINTIRRYRHNNSNGFVIAYDKEGVDSVVSELTRERKELLAQNERLRETVVIQDKSLRTYGSHLLIENQVCSVLAETPAQSLEAVKLEWKIEQKKRDALIMARARGMIKAHKSTSNGRLCSDVFGLGCGTGRDYCRELGLDPDSNETVYAKMIDHLNGASSGVVK